MKITCISDTHNSAVVYDNLPKSDLLIHAGDATGRGLPHEVMQFFRWTLPVLPKYKYGGIFVAGNHDFLFEKQEAYAREIISNWQVLIGQSMTIDGVKFYGFPWQPRFYDWAFNVDRDSPRMQELIDRIPDDTNVLISHGPPAGVLDKTRHERMGCSLLRKKVESMKNLKLCVFGHNHHGHGLEIHNGVTFVNAAIMNESYIPIDRPILVEI